MANKFIKPKKMAWQLISEMKNRGITFNYMNESEAVGYLSNINNYLRTASYRKNYQKYQKGYKQGKYLNLDFAYLVEMSILDMHYRFLIQKMCSDIEHRICVKLIYDVENDPLSNGYDIVHRFLTKRSYELRKIEGTIISPYTSDLLKKYFTIQLTENQKKINHTIIKYDDCPVWVLMELLSFGSIIDFYLEYYSSKGLPHFSRYILNLVRSLRNAAAHNNCILFNLNTGTTVPPQEITNFVKKLGNFSTSQR